MDDEKGLIGVHEGRRFRVNKDKKTGFKWLDPEKAKTTAGQAAAQGAFIDAPSNLVGIADLAVNRLDPRRNPPAGVPVTQVPPSNIGGKVRAGMEKVFEKTGTPTQTSNPTQDLIRSFTAGAAESAPFALIPGAGEAAMVRGSLGKGVRDALGRMVSEQVSGGFAESSRKMAETAGAGPWTQFALSAIAGVGARGVVEVGKTGALAGSRAAFKSRAAKAEKIVGRDLISDVPDRAQAMELLQKHIEAPLFGNVTSEQALVKQFPGIARRAELAIRTGVEGSDIRQTLLANQADNALAMQEWASKTFPAGGSATAAMDGPIMHRWEDRLAAFDRKITKMYKNTEKVAIGGKKLEGTIEGIPLSRVQTTMAAMEVDAGVAKAKFLPKTTMDLISGYGDTIDFQELRKLRSRVTNEVYGASKLLGKGSQESRYLTQLLGGIDSTMDELAQAGGAWEVQALRRAAQAYKLEGQMMGPNHPLNRIMGGEFENMDGRFASFLNTAAKPSEDLKVVKKVLIGNPDAWSGVQRLTRDNLYGEGFVKLLDKNGNLSAAKLPAIRKEIKRLENSINVVWGPEATNNSRAFLDQVELHTSGRGIKAADAPLMSPDGSNAELNELRRGLEIGTFNWRRAGIRLFALAAGRLPKTQDEVNRLWTNIMYDKQLMSGVFERLEGPALAAWHQKLGTAVGRELGRDIAGVKDSPPTFGDLMVQEKQ